MTYVHKPTLPPLHTFGTCFRVTMPTSDICSQSGSIKCWLSEHPDRLEDYELTTSSGQKRKRSRVEHAVSGSKRRTLGEIQPNTMPPPQPSPKRSGKQDQKSPEKNPTTPRATRKRDKQPDVFANEEPTPRASHRLPLLRKASVLHPPGYKDSEPDDGEVEDESSRESGSSRQKYETISSKRSVSPRKTRANMEIAEISVIIALLDSDEYNIPSAAQNLVDDLEDLQSQQRLLPSSIREYAREVLRKDNDSLYKQQTPAASKEISHHLRTWYNAIDILDGAKECFGDDCAESSWNMEVHSRTLRAALQGHWRSEGVWYRDITSARIIDKDLLPKVSGQSKSKMVDFAMILRPRALTPLWERIQDKCKSMPYNTINQTDASYVRKYPIAISMEVKRPAGNEDESLVEIETWVTAHYNMLKVLTRPNDPSANEVELPILPLLRVQGHHWKLMIAEYRRAKNRIFIYREVALGSTDKILGIYQIMASLQRLAEWVSEVYRPWWIKAALDIEPQSLVEDGPVDEMT